MNDLKQDIIIGAIFVAVIGSLAHFVYNWSGNNRVVGFFTPINESVWEHTKLLFFPMLIYSLLLVYKYKEYCSCIIPSLCFGILSGTLLIPIFFYAYTSILGKNFLILDIIIFILSVILAFYCSYNFILSCSLKPCTLLLCILVCALFICFIIFTYHPPNIKIFDDPTHPA